MDKAISIKDLARLAGVSHATVSRALRNSALVNQATAEKIQKLAAEHGYRASLVARSLVTRKTKTIGCVVTTISDPFVAEVIAGVEEAATQQGYSVILANSNGDPGRELENVMTFEDRRVEGILVLASRVGAEYSAYLETMRAAIVLINNEHSASHIHSVMMNNETATAAVMTHLLRLNHRRIGYIGSTEGHFSDEERLHTYASMLRDSGGSVDGDLVVYGDGKPDGGARAMNQLLSRPERPTAVFCFNDHTALGALHATHASGLNVPGDISIVGFDDLPLASFTHPPLTTMHQPMRQMGQKAMEDLLSLFNGETPPRQFKFDGELIVRASTCASGTGA